MPISITFAVNTRDVEAALNGASKQAPFALARALTSVARSAVGDIQAGMKKSFRNPTPYTLKAFYAKPATKADLTAWVGTRENAGGKGTPAANYLAPNIEGGPRPFKGMEIRIGKQAVGSPEFVIPARGAERDGDGNWSRGQIGQMLSRLSTMSDAGQSISATTTRRLHRMKLTVAATGHRSNYFVAHAKGNGAPIGIWRLVAKGHVEPVAIFALGAPQYAPIFDLHGIVAESIGKNWPRAVSGAITEALATAKG